ALVLLLPTRGQENWWDIRPSIGPVSAQAVEIRWTAPRGLAHLDPHGLPDLHAQGLIGHAYEGLTTRNADLSIEPGLATSWQVIRDDRWRFFLRVNAQFHDGQGLDSLDVERSLNRARAEGSALEDLLRGIRGVRRVDRSTVDIFTRGPLPDLPERLVAAAIMDADWLREREPGSPQFGAGGAVSQEVNGTGPYRISSFKANGPVTFRPHTRWWKRGSRGQSIGPNEVTSAVLYPHPDPAQRMGYLLENRVDVALDLPLGRQADLIRTPTVEALTFDSARTLFLGLDQRPDGPFAPLLMRQAVSRAINTGLLADGLLAGASLPAGLITAPSVLGTPRAQYGLTLADPAQARALFDQARAEGLMPQRPLILDCPSGRYPRDETVCEAVALMLRTAGLEVQARPAPAQEAFRRILTGRTDLFLIGLQPWTLEVTDPLRLLAACPPDDPAQRTPDGLGALNAGGYCDPETHRMVLRLETELFTPKRHGIASQIMIRLSDAVAYVPLVQAPMLWGRRTDISMMTRADGVFDLRFVALSP
ncbi:MAG: ABC transporter substrate-binding protein, partial [Rhodospirillaceae bacterium]